MMMMMSMLLLVSPALADPAAVEDTHTASPARIEYLWIREAPPTAKVMAAYGTLCNDDKEVLILVAAESESFSAVEMHASRESDSTVTMERLNDVPIAPGACVMFEPGARHFMLMDPVRSLRSGDEVTLTLQFANGMEQDVAVPVRRADEMDTNPNHEHH
ncbi:MAG: copper chaperone PCu(A)C [Proteobacteria bacterium]|nr:copper chaperone PCu(A)C [Pseudomonadota bacterium]